jgi:hypothetical protein
MSLGEATPRRVNLRDRGRSRYRLGVPAASTSATVPAARRSAYPPVAGVPPWGAVVIASTLTILGLAVEAASGDQELGAAFSACFALGCILAVIAVRHSAIFTAVVQPPLLLFVAVPAAYYLFHRSEFASLKGFLITCGYPLIERFPLMLFTSAAVLLVGMARWYLAMSPGRGAAHAAVAEAEPAVRSGPGRSATLAARLTALLAGRDTAPPRQREPRRPPRPVAERRGGAARPPRPHPAAAARSGRDRRPEYPARGRVRLDGYRDHPPHPDHRDYPDYPPPRRRPRESYESEPAVARHRRSSPPPPAYRGHYPPRPARAGGPRPHQDSYPPRYRSQPPAARPDSHHPVSRVRYRGEDAGSRAEPGRPGYPRDTRR